MQTDNFVVKTVARIAPLLNTLIKEADTHRFKVQVLIEAQRIAGDLGLPRLSPEASLLELVFDGLYRAEVIEEEYFEWWSDANDDTPGKTAALFQVNPFMSWLAEAKVVGEESSDDDDDEDGDDDEDEDDDEDYDIEENVPKRAGVHMR